MQIAHASRSKSYGAGPFLIICGILCAVYFWSFYDTSVSTGFGSVNNIGLMQNRQLGVIVGIAVAVVGVILVAISKKPD
jgi:hypothetical protein